MSLPSSSSATSSPSLNYNIPQSPEQEDIAEAQARFNPLFIHTAINANHNQTYPKYKDSLSHYNSPPNNLGHNINRSVNTNAISNSTNSIALEHSSINQSKFGTNTSSSSMQSPPPPPTAPSRKVHVVYYLSRSGQLEHPHLLEVSIPPNQGLYLRDVKRRLAVIRGNRLPSAFAWSYKRSYKNGYVWQDLCDDDLIFPAHGCEYVLKGSEILHDQRSTAQEEECAQNSNVEAGQGTLTNVTKEDQGLASRDPKETYQNLYEASVRMADSTPLHVSMVESGTDAATQTEEDLGPDTDINQYNGQEVATNGRMYSEHQDVELAKHPSDSSPHREACTTTRPQNAIELNNAEFASPPSSSSATNSPSPYKQIASTSSSSASGFTVTTDCSSVRESSSDHAKPISESINSGSKTPGRPWMKKAIQKLEEQGEILCLHSSASNGAGTESVVNEPSSANKNAGNKVINNRRMGSNSVAAVIMEEADHPPAASVKPSRVKHSSALSLLQFMSCGGLDIKEQILPMSLYRLRSRGTPAAANQLHMSNYVLSPEHSSVPDSLGTYGSSETGNLWTRFSKPKSSCLNGSVSKPLCKGNDELTNGEGDGRQIHRHYSQPIPANSVAPSANGSSAKSLGASVPDVISIGRSSLSDRSTNASHELEYMDSHGRLKRSEEVVNSCNNVVKSSPQFNARSEALPTVCNNEGTRLTRSTRAVSGEIVMCKGSPLFVPGKRHLSYSGTPLNYVSSGIKPLAQLISTSALQAHPESGSNATSSKQDGENKTVAPSNSCNPSRAFSDGEVSCMFTNRSGVCKSGEQRSATINGYDRSMAQLWEELLAAPAVTSSEEHQPKDGDFQRVRHVTMGSGSTWEVERTLQNAVELSLQPPLEHHLLHIDCPQCGRKVKAEAMKAHAKGCNSLNHGNVNCLNANLNSFGKSPKSDSNLCQRFLRASPTPPPKL